MGCFDGFGNLPDNSAPKHVNVPHFTYYILLFHPITLIPAEEEAISQVDRFLPPVNIITGHTGARRELLTRPIHDLDRLPHTMTHLLGEDAPYPPIPTEAGIDTDPPHHEIIEEDLDLEKGADIRVVDLEKTRDVISDPASPSQNILFLTVSL